MLCSCVSGHWSGHSLERHCCHAIFSRQFVFLCLSRDISSLQSQQIYGRSAAASLMPDNKETDPHIILLVLSSLVHLCRGFVYGKRSAASYFSKCHKIITKEQFFPSSGSSSISFSTIRLYRSPHCTFHCFRLSPPLRFTSLFPDDIDDIIAATAISCF